MKQENKTGFNTSDLHPILPGLFQLRIFCLGETWTKIKHQKVLVSLHFSPRFAEQGQRQQRDPPLTQPCFPGALYRSIHVRQCQAVPLPWHKHSQKPEVAPLQMCAKAAPHFHKGKHGGSQSNSGQKRPQGGLQPKLLLQAESLKWTAVGLDSLVLKTSKDGDFTTSLSSNLY